MIDVMAIFMLVLGSAGGALAAVSPVGVWGGDRLNLTIDARGGAIETDCGRGTIAMPIHPDRHGRFTTAVAMERFRAGPQMADAGPATRKVTVAGRIVGDVLELQIPSADTGPLQRYRLQRGQRVKLVRCL